jgi:hypothetical protein
MAYGGKKNSRCKSFFSYLVFLRVFCVAEPVVQYEQLYHEKGKPLSILSDALRGTLASREGLFSINSAGCDGKKQKKRKKRRGKAFSRELKFCNLRPIRGAKAKVIQVRKGGRKTNDHSDALNEQATHRGATQFCPARIAGSLPRKGEPPCLSMTSH